MNSWKPSQSPAFVLIPFFYFLGTRINRFLDAIFLVATSFVPAWWILTRGSDLTALEAGVSFLIGYLCFISFYEIGYFFNDTWDALRQKDGGRRRIGFKPGLAYSSLFIALRLAIWGGAAYFLGWLGNPVWLACYAALALAMAQHNLIASSAYRAASFYQLAVLRFICPIAGALPKDQLVSAILPALLLYTYIRYLSYLDSKDLLLMPERREPTFGVVQIGMLAPLVAVIAYMLNNRVLLELLGYYFVVFGGFALVQRVKARDPAATTTGSESP